MDLRGGRGGAAARVIPVAVKNVCVRRTPSPDGGKLDANRQGQVGSAQLASGRSLLAERVRELLVALLVPRDPVYARLLAAGRSTSGRATKLTRGPVQRLVRPVVLATGTITTANASPAARPRPPRHRRGWPRTTTKGSPPPAAAQTTASPRT
jgi:hypothetical protein